MSNISSEALTLLVKLYRQTNNGSDYIHLSDVAMHKELYVELWKAKCIQVELDSSVPRGAYAFTKLGINTAQKEIQQTKQIIAAKTASAIKAPWKIIIAVLTAVSLLLGIIANYTNILQLLVDGPKGNITPTESPTIIESDNINKITIIPKKTTL